MPYYLLTFRAHPNDSKLFEEFMDYFPPLLNEYPSYAWVVEEDNTLCKHFHAVIETNKTKSKKTFFEKFKNKNLMKFRDMAISSSNTHSQGFHNRKVEDTEEDLLRCLGYTQKEGTPERSGYKGFTREYLEKSYHFYKVSARVKKDALPDDIMLLTLKNAYAHIETYCKKNDIRPDNPMTKLLMQKDRYAFETIGSKEKQQSVLDELDVIMNPQEYSTDEGGYYSRSHYMHAFFHAKSELSMLQKKYNNLKIATTPPEKMSYDGKELY